MSDQSKLFDEFYDSGSETELDNSDKENQLVEPGVLQDITYDVPDMTYGVPVVQVEDEDNGTVEEIIRADQSRKEFSHKDRIRVHVLRELGWTMRDISIYTEIPLGSIHNICTMPATPRKRRGRPRILTTPTRKRLIDFIQESAANRRMNFLEVALQCGMFIY